MDLEPQHDGQRFKLNLNKAFEIFGALIILTFMGVVVWQSIGIDKTMKQVAEYNSSDLSKKDVLDNTDSVAPPTETPVNIEESVFCTMDAMVCPDGSFVGRVAPNCEFAHCPTQVKNGNPKSITCPPEPKFAYECTMEYRPVCGLTEIQCVTTPCNPIRETYGNACTACAQGNVDSYTEGPCVTDVYDQ